MGGHKHGIRACTSVGDIRTTTKQTSPSVVVVRASGEGEPVEAETLHCGQVSEGIVDLAHS